MTSYSTGYLLNHEIVEFFVLAPSLSFLPRDFCLRNKKDN